MLEEGKDGQDANTDETAEPIVLSSDDVVIEAEVVETIPEPVPQPEIIEVEELSEDNSDPPQQNN